MEWLVMVIIGGFFLFVIIIVSVKNAVRQAIEEVIEELKSKGCSRNKDEQQL